MRTVVKISIPKTRNGTNVHVNDLLRYGRFKYRQTKRWFYVTPRAWSIALNRYVMFSATSATSWRRKFVHVMDFYVSHCSRIFVFAGCIRITENIGSVLLTIFQIPVYFLLCLQRLVVCMADCSACLRVGRLARHSRQTQKFSFSPVVQTRSGTHPACNELDTSSFYSENHSAGR
jgi:hypothetical protein